MLCEIAEAGSAGPEKLRARQRLGPRPGASEASHASQDPARRRRPKYSYKLGILLFSDTESGLSPYNKVVASATFSF